MIHAMRHAAAFATAAVIALAAGCAVNSSFAYKPNPATAGGPKLPAKVAVLPFVDGTENFTMRGSVFSDGRYNLAKAGMYKSMDALTPEFWGKSFADELAASGSFRAVRFVYGRPGSRKRTTGRGHPEESHLRGHVEYPNEILVSFRSPGFPTGKSSGKRKSTKRGRPR